MSAFREKPSLGVTLVLDKSGDRTETIEIDALGVLKDEPTIRVGW